MINVKRIVNKYELLEDDQKSCCDSHYISMFAGLFIRFLFVMHGSSLMIFVLKDEKFQHLIYSSVFLIVIIIEGVYVTFLREGKESKYFSLCNLFYIFACLPCFWTFFLRSMQSISNLENIQDARLYEKIEFNEIIFFVLIVLSKWLLPRDDLNAEETYALILQNLCMAADAHEIFQMIENVQKAKNLSYTLLILAIWSFSLPLFMINTTTESGKDKIYRENSDRLLELLYGNYFWKYIAYVIMMDCTYFILRLILLLNENEIGYESIFYISKNFLQIGFQIYRIVRSIYFPRELYFE